MGLINIVSEVFGLQDVVGTVVLSALPYGLISASGREFAVFRANTGERSIEGTAGQHVAGMLDEERSLPGFTYHFLGLRQDTGTARGAAILPCSTPVTNGPRSPSTCTTARAARTRARATT